MLTQRLWIDANLRCDLLLAQAGDCKLADLF